MIKKLVITIFLALLVALPINVNAQNLNSTNYTLLAPSIDSSVGIVDSTNYSILGGTSPVDDFTTSSTNYRFKGGTASFIEAYVPSVTCFETSTNSGTTNCTGIPGADGMRGVCSTPGCYNRAKLEINANNNPLDVKYSIQIATNSLFTTGVQYITGANRLPKSTLALSDFLYKCEWEGTISVGYCAAANTTYQKYNILGLTPGTLYYVRVAALKGTATNGTFSQSEWGPSATATTENTSITFDIDITTNIVNPSTPPYNLNSVNIVPEATSTSSEYIVFKITSNALNGTRTLIKSANANLTHISLADTIASYTGDLDSVANGFGIRNDSTTNSQTNSGNLGTITVSSTPTDYTDTGAANKVGGVPTTLTQLFNSNNLPILNGVSAYKLKVKADFSKRAGIYTETFSVVPFGIY